MNEAITQIEGPDKVLLLVLVFWPKSQQLLSLRADLTSVKCKNINKIKSHRFQSSYSKQHSQQQTVFFKEIYLFYARFFYANNNQDFVLNSEFILSFCCCCCCFCCCFNAITCQNNICRYFIYLRLRSATE